MSATPVRILVLDPDADAARRTLAQLAAGGLVLEESRHLAGEDPQAMAAMLESFTPDLVLCERDLPALPGLEALRWLRTRLPALPLIYCCERADDAFALEALRAGAGDCVAKSAPLRLVGAVEVALRQAAERRIHTQLGRELVQAQRYESLPLLLSALAHDLRNVLQPLMFAGVMLQKSDDPALARLNETLDNTTQKGLDIVSSMMAFCKGGEAGEDDLNVQALLRALRLLLPKKATRRVELSFDSSLGTVPCRLNQAEIEQCLLSLALRAIRAMPDGGRLRFDIARTRLDAGFFGAGEAVTPGDYLRLSVEHGGGAPAEAPEHPDDLALTIGHAVARQYHGLLRMGPRPGGGSGVDLYLPLRPEAAAEQAPRAPQAVLFATGDDGAARSLATAGAPVGFDVARVVDSETAARYIDQHRLPDLAIIDTDLPRLEDARVFSLLRERQFAGSVILLASPGAEMEHDASGAVKLMTKPVDENSLLAALRDCAGSTPGAAG